MIFFCKWKVTTLSVFSLLILLLNACSAPEPKRLELSPGDRIALIGGNLCSRMMHYGHFETELHLRYPTHQLYIRNMCDGGDTPGFRPHSGRDSAWVFPGAKDYQTEYAQASHPEGHFAYPDEWLTQLETDIIIACFGYSESFAGPAGLRPFRAELDTFVRYTLQQKYNGVDTPRLALVSPIAFQNLSDRYDLPDGQTENENLKMYTEVIQEVAQQHNLVFVDAFSASQKWYSDDEEWTIDGSQLNDAGYQGFARFLADHLFGELETPTTVPREQLRAAVLEKNWMWHNDYKIPNGVHVYGRRYDPFGPDNYPAELTKIRQMTAIRDTAVWLAAQGEVMDLAQADARTDTLPSVPTNYSEAYGHGNRSYRYGEEALQSFTMAEGFQIELFASEVDFPDLANPVQLSFDNKGRLWVATMPTYPHYRPGDPKPNDKLIILEDTDGDGKADQQTTFVEGLHIPAGFELSPDGVYVSQGTHLKLFTDTDGDDRADREEIILSGFDDHDTHHVISAFCADPSGAIYMGEGVFLHSNVETSYGTIRATNGGFFRYSPQRRKLERSAQIDIPNPWGTAFDEWGQPFFAETSGFPVRWLTPSTILPRYGRHSPKSADLIDFYHRVRPTSGLEFVSSRHFPEEMQGDFLINNVIGFLGTKQHQIFDDTSGYRSRHRQDLLKSDDPNFRPVDMEFAPDGSLYLVDWHNVLIGHMQHNARDPLRDHVHGRIYRITYPARPLLEPAKIAGASIPTLLDHLTLPEYRTRYRTRRELRGRDATAVMKAISSWLTTLDANHPRYEHHLLEGLWVSWGLNRVDADLLEKLLQADDFRVRAAAVKVLRYTGHQISNQTALLQRAASDTHARVRMEAMVAASWLERSVGTAILQEAAQHPFDSWMKATYTYAQAHLDGVGIDDAKQVAVPDHLRGEDRTAFIKGQEIYRRDGYCSTCHQVAGEGLLASDYPPLAGTKWVLGNEERLIKLTLKGLYGPIRVLGKDYPGQVPMTPYGGMLDDTEVAAVLTYVRNAFGNQASVIRAEQVQRVRAAIRDKEGFYSPEELLQQHPHSRTDIQPSSGDL